MEAGVVTEWHRLSDEPRRRSAIVADVQPVWLNAVEQLLLEHGFAVVATAPGHDVVLELVDEREPDLLVLGVDVEPLDAVVAIIHQARLRHPELRVVVVGTSADERAVAAAFRAGAGAYCIRTVSSDDLAVAIRQCFEHKIYLGRLHEAQGADDERWQKNEPALTRRELEILRLVARGHSNVQLARMLWITEQTVKFHLSNVYRKLGVANRTQASRWAQAHGLLPEPSADDSRPAIDVVTAA